MREIKFRAKDIETKEWRYGYYVVILGQHKIINSSGQEYFVDGETVGQWTGVMEIYDGDIITLYGGKYAIRFIEGEFVGKNEEEELQMFEMTCGVVIGNVTDNPELLTQ